MARPRKSNKEDKKKTAMSMKEKRAAKKVEAGCQGIVRARERTAPTNARPCILSESMHQRRERWTNEDDSMKVKVNENVRNKGCTHAISER